MAENNNKNVSRQIPRKRDLRMTPKAGFTRGRRRLKTGGDYE